MDVHGFTVGQVAENCFFAARDGATQAIVVDPGDEGDRLIAALDELGLGVEAILLTHTHFDHVGAVAPLARHTGAPVYCPELEKHVLADIMSYVPWPGFGPFESYDADVLVAGGERLELAGFEIDVLFTPGHSPGHVTYAIAALEVTVEAILLTHTHFDHVGAVAPLARATGAPVTCPALEVELLKSIPTFPGFGPYEGWTPEHTVEGGEVLDWAGLRCEVLFTPGHSPGHVTYAFDGVLASGDVLFESSIGRTDLPGGDWPTLAESLRKLVEGYPPETVVYPGHMGITTLGAERATNPFLAELAS